MPCGTRSKENRVEAKVTRCNFCGKKTETKHKHKRYLGMNWNTRTSRWSKPREAGLVTKTEWTYLCPAKEAMKLINKLAEGGAAADLPKEVVISRAKTRCKCGCGRLTLVVQHTHEKVPA